MKSTTKYGPTAIIPDDIHPETLMSRSRLISMYTDPLNEDRRSRTNEVSHLIID